MTITPNSYQHTRHLDMVTKPTNAQKRLRVSSIIYLVCLLHVSATRVLLYELIIHTEEHYKVCVCVCVCVIEKP